MAAIPIGRPVSPNIAVSAIELSGDVQIIFIIPPNKNPITIGDWSVAAEIVAPMCDRIHVTPGSTTVTIIRATGAITSAPAIMLIPTGSFFSIIGAMNPMT